MTVTDACPICSTPPGMPCQQDTTGPCMASAITAERIARAAVGVPIPHWAQPTDGTFILSQGERELVARIIDLAFVADEALGLNLRGRPHVEHLRKRLAPTVAHLAAVPDPEMPEVSRPQELAADAMAAKYGRSGVRRLGDGAVEITGMTDDVARELVCIEQDGRERWRR